MPTYEVQQYELHTLTYRVQANDEADAIAKVFRGEGEPDSFQFCGVANDYGLALSENEALSDQLFDRGIIKSDDHIIPSIRSVKQVSDRGEEHE
jgi:hypothetical protein